MKNKKKFMIGAYSVGITAVVIAVVIALNLLVGQLPSTITKLDATPEKIISVGDESKKVLDNVDTEITLYHIYQEGYEDVSVSGMLERYADASSKIKVEVVDPVSRPTFIQEYTDASLSQNSIIVESEKRSTYVNGVDLYQYQVQLEGYEGQYMSQSEYEYLNQMYQNYYGQSVAATPYFFAENEITRAIDYVSHDDLPIVYTLAGHGETAVNSGAIGTLISDENVELKDLELAAGETVAVPEDAEALIINIPQADLSEAERDAVIAYLDEGGQVILNTYVAVYSAELMPNLAAVCSHMGLKAVENYVFESDATGYTQYPFYLLPKITGNGITGSITETNLYVYMIESHAILPTGENENVTTASLLETTDGAYLYTDEMASDPENTALVDEADKAVRSLAYQSTLADSEGSSAGTLYWFASPYFLNDNFAKYGNGEIFTTILTAVCEKPTAVSIIGKQVSQTYLALNEAQSTLWSAVVVGVIPLISIVAGFVVWIKRRRK